MAPASWSDQPVRSAGADPPLWTTTVSAWQSSAATATAPPATGGVVVVVAVVAVDGGMVRVWGSGAVQVPSMTRRSSISFWSALRSQAFFTVTQSLAYSHHA